MKKISLIKPVRKYTLKASYTIEGALIMGICILVITACILLAFEIYHESMEYLENTNIREMDFVETFRQIRAGKKILDGIIKR